MYQPDPMGNQMIDGFKAVASEIVKACIFIFVMCQVWNGIVTFFMAWWKINYATAGGYAAAINYIAMGVNEITLFWQIIIFVLAYRFAFGAISQRKFQTTYGTMNNQELGGSTSDPYNH